MGEGIDIVAEFSVRQQSIQRETAKLNNRDNFHAGMLTRDRDASKRPRSDFRTRCKLLSLRSKSFGSSPLEEE